MKVIWNNSTVTAVPVVLVLLSVIVCLSLFIHRNQFLNDHPHNKHNLAHIALTTPLRLRALSTSPAVVHGSSNTTVVGTHHTGKTTHHKHFAALNHLICEDHESMQYFHWRLDWHWPHCPYVHDKYEESLGRKVIPGSPIIPIFVILSDKVTDMKEFLRSLHTSVESSFQVVVLETFARMSEGIVFVDWLREHHVPVIFCGSLYGPGSLNNVGSIIDRYMIEHPDYLYYIVTDPDISLHGVRKNVLEVYADILVQEFTSPVVGPDLIIDDIPHNTYSQQSLPPDGKGIVDWELQFWPQQMGSLLNESRKQRVYYHGAYIDTTFGMYRRNNPWLRLNNGIRVTYPYAMRHVDWYYSPETGLPLDMIKYPCSKYSMSITHLHLPNCPELLAKHNLSQIDYIKDFNMDLLVNDEQNNTFNHNRILRVINQQTELHIKVGDLPSDYRRFPTKLGHNNKPLHEPATTPSSPSSPSSTVATQHEYWIEITPNFRSFSLTERHMILPYLAVPATTPLAEIMKVPWFINRDVPTCSSALPTLPFHNSKDSFVKEYSNRCNKIEEELKKNVDKEKKHPTIDPLKTIKENMQPSVQNHSYTCVAGNNLTVFQESRAALPLSYILEQFRSFPIRVLDIGSKGADASLLYSIEAHLPSIEHIRCECQRGTSSYYYQSSVNNNCDEIATFLQKHHFEIDYIQVTNCGLEEYLLQASNKAYNKKKYPK